MLKNPSLRKIALYISIAITIVFTLFFVLQELVFVTNGVLVRTFIFALICIVVSFVIVLLGVKLFVHERIKLIYKNIHKIKQAGKNDKGSLFARDDAMDEVEKDVNQFVTDQDQEIQTLKSLENYRREFLGNVSHELKTPIFNIQGYIHTLLEGGLFDNNINLDYLQRAANSTERLQVIVEDLTAISKLESGTLQLNLENFDIRTLVEEVYAEQEFLTKAKNISLIFNDTTAANYRVNADKENIRRVLNNLITNAVKYNQENGRVKASFYEMDQNVLIEIADNGPGIEEKHLPHLFDRFYRADEHRSRAIGGSGLGLSIVKHIIEAHKQTIHVRSSPEVGTTFGFTLKRAV
jgi:two-component system phosphate regulon sensor histidine kinase PhoR